MIFFWFTKAPEVRVNSLIKATAQILIRQDFLFPLQEKDIDDIGDLFLKIIN